MQTLSWTPAREDRGRDIPVRQQTKLTNIVPWTFVKRCGLNLLQERVGPPVAIQHEPYLRSVAVHDHGHLKAAKERLRCRQCAINGGRAFLPVSRGRRRCEEIPPCSWEAHAGAAPGPVYRWTQAPGRPHPDGHPNTLWTATLYCDSK